MRDRPVARPMIAVAIGSSAAVTEPKANMRMITAATRPIASLLSVWGLETAWPR